MRKFALIGHPLGHSLSPQIHTKLFSLDGYNESYELIDIPPEELESRFDELRTYDGLNVTIPHKMSIISMCDKLDITAKRYGTMNCIKSENGKHIGYNTDVLGFVKSIEQMGATLNSKVLLIGCGGAGRMIALETLYQGGDLTIAVLKSDFDATIALKSYASTLIENPKVKVALVDEIEGEFDLIVNSTPIGMFPKVDNSPVTAEVLKNCKHAFDLVFNPSETKFLKLARENGANAMGGMAMLVLQAVAAHEIWDNSHYNEEDINNLIAEMEKLV